MAGALVSMEDVIVNLGSVGLTVQSVRSARTVVIRRDCVSGESVSASWGMEESTVPK